MGSQATIISLFVEGMLSFFSPCILPLIPLYIGYLTADAKTIEQDGTITYKRSKVLATTFSFVLGISMVFFIAGLSLSAFKDFLLDYQLVFSMIGGMFLILFGLIHLNVLSLPILNHEYRLPMKIDVSKMNLVKSFLLGFFFSFAWSPCIGPMLTSALILAASATSIWIGNLYIIAYALGFILMFVLLGFFTEEILRLLKKYQHVMKYTVILGGVLMIVMGSWMLLQSSRDIVALQKNGVSNSNQSNGATESGSVLPENQMQEFNFTLFDQNGKQHTLLDYKGNTVLVTFFATWCEYCKDELVILQELAKEDPALKILIVTRPNYGEEVDEDGIKQFISDNGYDDMTFVFDADGQVSNLYRINGYPTTYIYKPTGEMLGYIPGAAAKEQLIEFIEVSREE